MKKKKIVVTGVLGYLGSALCEILQGEVHNTEIIGIDNRFLSARVKQLTDWGIKFINADIMRCDVMLGEFNNALKDADVVYHLCGVTDVAYVKTQQNEEKDKLIREIGIEGTRKLLSCLKPTCKVIFPSTHVIYEGLKETKFNIDESFPPVPVLTYAIGKVQSEEDIRQSGLDYIIVRLGSVYGYAETDSMRINIMPNLFSQRTSQSGGIDLYCGGVQFKSLVALQDVVRAMKYLADSDTIKKETFNLSNENMTIKEVSDICKKINPEVQIWESIQEIPNLGYTLSNTKLLKTGFKFLYNIEDSIREMITKWSAKPQREEMEYIDKGGKEFADARGVIRNYELKEPINLIGAITSKAMSVRANHFHEIQTQQCLLISGRYISITKDLLDPHAVVETRMINAGDLAIIKPNVAHAMIFIEDSVFLNLVRGEREHENYGITHTKPYELVDRRLSIVIPTFYKSQCRSCGYLHLDDVLSLGLSPLANNLTDAGEIADTYPLDLKYCPNCYNVQLSIVVPPDTLFDKYLYQSSTAASFRKHFEDAAKKYKEEFNLDGNTLTIDIGSNDGIALKPLQDMGVKVLGIEPAKNIAAIANANGIETLNSYLDGWNETKQIVEKYGKARLVTASNVFAHSDKLGRMLMSAFELLDEKGVFIVEVQYLVDTIIDLTFDNIYHEHVNYWSVTSLNNFVSAYGKCLYKVEHIDTHGGSIRCYIARSDGDNIYEDDSVAKLLKMEEQFGFKEYETYKKFGRRVREVKDIVLNNIKALKEKYPRIASYGSPAKATTALNYFGIDNSIIEYTIEDNPLKHGKFIPVVNIPIVSKEYALQNLPNLIIVLAWNFFDEIVKNNQDLREKGVVFISIQDLQRTNLKHI